VDFEVRSTTSESLSFSAQRLKNIQSTYSGPGQLEIDVGPPILPLEESEQSRELAGEYARAAIKAGLSGGIVPRQGGVSDANFVAQSRVPVIDGLGPLGGGAHTKEEYVIARSLYDKSLALIYFLLAQP
jgi:glutamate carboxypeptidase